MDQQQSQINTSENSFHGWSLLALGSFSVGILFFLFLNVFLTVFMGSFSVFSKGLIAFLVSAGIIIAGGLGLREVQTTNIKGTAFAVLGILIGSLALIFSIILMVSSQITGSGNKEIFYDEKVVLTKQTLVNYVGVLEIYKKQHGVYPETLIKAVENSPLVDSLITAQKIPDVVFSDVFGQPFFYDIFDDGKSYDVRSVGLDGEYGTDDDITVF